MVTLTNILISMRFRLPGVRGGEGITQSISLTCCKQGPTGTKHEVCPFCFVCSTILSPADGTVYVAKCSTAYLTMWKKKSLRFIFENQVAPFPILVDFFPSASDPEK